MAEIVAKNGIAIGDGSAGQWEQKSQRETDMGDILCDTLYGEKAKGDNAEGTS